jgi:uncharacterized membrane protein (UPF0127 family)
MADRLVTVENSTRRTVLGRSIREAKSFLSRGRGLMLSEKLCRDEGLLIEPCSSIHTWFMRFPIDVLYVDRDDVVLRADPEMKPWRFGPVFTGAHWVLELPPGAIRDSETEPGDRLLIHAASE